MIGLFILAAVSAPMDAATQRDFMCAQLTSREIKITPTGDARTSYENAHAYYLGRLSGRDQGQRWLIPRWEDRIKDAVKLHSTVEPEYSARLLKCMNYYIDEMPDLASE